MLKMILKLGLYHLILQIVVFQSLKKVVLYTKVNILQVCKLIQLIQGITDWRKNINLTSGVTYTVSFRIYHTEGNVRTRIYAGTLQKLF